MPSPDILPAWKVDAQASLPQWSTKEPITYDDLLDGTLFDTKGRPLTEHPRQNLAEVPFVFKPLPFSDSREGKEGNSSAYEAVVAEREKSFAVLSLLRSKILPYDRPVTLEGLTAVTNAGTVLPWWYANKADNPVPNGELPPYITGVAKTCRGLTIPFDRADAEATLARYQRKKIKPDTTFLQSPEAFFNYVNNEGFLISDGTRFPKDIACPASKPVIMQGAKILLEKPTDGWQEAVSDVPLTDKDIWRVRKMGMGLRGYSSATTVYDKIGFRVTLDEFAQMQARGLTSPLDLNTKAHAADRAAKGQYISDINNAQRRLNESLGRRTPTPLRDKDVDDRPHLVYQPIRFGK